MRTGKRRRHPARWVAAGLLLLIGLSFWRLDGQLRRAVAQMVEYQTGLLASGWMTGSVGVVLGEAGELVRVTTGPAGEVTAIQTDAAAAALVCDRVSRQLSRQLADYREPMEIPLGSLTASQWLAGRGPRLRILLEPEGRVTVELESRLVSGGINQASHQLWLVMEMTVGAVSSFGELEVTVPGRFLLAETVVVGELPDGMVMPSGTLSSSGDS